MNNPPSVSQLISPAVLINSAQYSDVALISWQAQAELQSELNLLRFVSEFIVFESLHVLCFLQGKVVRKGRLVSLADDNFILKTVIQGTFSTCVRLSVYVCISAVCLFLC